MVLILIASGRNDMRFWNGLIGFLSLGKVVGQNEPVVFENPVEVTWKNIIQEATDAFGNSQAGVDVKRACIVEMLSEAVKSGSINIEASSKDYLPACFEVFSTKDKPNSEELEESDESYLKNSDINKDPQSGHKQRATHWEWMGDSIYTIRAKKPSVLRSSYDEIDTTEPKQEGQVPRRSRPEL